MKKWSLLLLLLAGCSLDPNAADKYVQEPALTADLHVTNGAVRIQTNPEARVTAKWWKQGEKPAALLLTQQESGVYTARKTWTKDGIYFVQAVVKTAGQQARPVQKVVVGSAEEKEKTAPKTNGHSHH